MDPTQQPGLQFAQIFLLQAHFAHREDVMSLPPNFQVGELNIVVQTKVGANPEDTEGIVSITVSTRPEDNPAYIFVVEMVAIIQRDQNPNLPPSEYIRTNGTAVLFPFVREVVANLTWRGRFGPIWLKPLNLTISGTPASVGPMAQADQPPEDKTPGSS